MSNLSQATSNGAVSVPEESMNEIMQLGPDSDEILAADEVWSDEHQDNGSPGYTIRERRVHIRPLYLYNRVYSNFI